MKWKKTILEYSGNSKKEKNLFIFYHFWGGSSRIYFPYESLVKEGTCIFYDYSLEILTSNVDDTVKNFKIIVKDSLREIQKRTEKKCKVSVFGSSIGSHIAFKVASECKEVKNIVLNTIGDNFAFNVWNGIATKVIKKNIENKGIDYEELDKKWKYISPIYSVKKIRNKNILLFTSSLDEVILYSTQKKILAELKKQNTVVVENEPLPHAFVVIRNIFKIKKIKDFMMKQELI